MSPTPTPDLLNLENIETLKSVIISTARDYHIDPDLFIRIATCESGLKPTAKNLRSTASGLFQFLDSTFFSYAHAYELHTENKNDPMTQIKLAAKMISDGGISHWNASKSCWNQKSNESSK